MQTRFRTRSRRDVLAELVEQTAEALDRLHAIERARPHPHLRAVPRTEHEAMRDDPTGCSLRSFIVRRGLDVATIFGPEAMIEAAAAVRRSRPERAEWNLYMLMALWSRAEAAMSNSAAWASLPV